MTTLHTVIYVTWAVFWVSWVIAGRERQSRVAS